MQATLVLSFLLLAASVHGRGLKAGIGFAPARPANGPNNVTSMNVTRSSVQTSSKALGTLKSLVS
jgi:hypothetical protein